MSKYFFWAIWLVPIFSWMETCLRPMSEPDVPLYFALIEKYLATGSWPTTDPFLYTLPNEALVSVHEWLGYWIYYLPFTALGWGGPILIKWMVVGIFFLVPLIPLFLKRQPVPLHYAAVWTLAVFATFFRFKERPSLIGDLFVTVLTVGLLWGREKRWFWWSLPPFFILWAQIHPSWLLGWIILIAFFMSQRPATWRSYMLIPSGLCLLAPFANPEGIDGVLIPFTVMLKVQPYLRKYIYEWLPLTDPQLYEFWFIYLPFLTIVPFLIWRLWTQRREAAYFEWFLLLFAVIQAARTVRFGYLAQGIYLALLVFSDWRAKTRWEPPKAVTIGVTLILLTAQIHASSRFDLSFKQRFALDAFFPERAVNFLEAAKPKMHIFNSFGYGGYLAWRWKGDPPIFCHSFWTNYGFFEENIRNPQTSRENLDRLIAKYDLGIFLLTKQGSDDNFIELLNVHPQWEKLFEDRVSVVFALKSPRLFAHNANPFF